MNYCSRCGERLSLEIPTGDDRFRSVCRSCSTIHYENPKIVLGAIPVFDDQILLCKRGIEPHYGLWTIPSGFMENGESVEEGAIRETIEEANAEIQILRLQTVYSIPQINQVHVIFLANLLNSNFFPGTESLETRLFALAEIPWNHLAFEAIRFALRSYLYDKDISDGRVHIGTYGMGSEGPQMV
jgi:ADP-ribose pyrophosphatase YjhB (NUDIX family)